MRVRRFFFSLLPSFFLLPPFMIFNDFMIFDVHCLRKHIFVVDNEVPSLVPTHILIFLLISSSFLFSLQHVSSLYLCFILLTFFPSIFSLSLCLSSSSSLHLYLFFPFFFFISSSLFLSIFLSLSCSFFFFSYLHLSLASYSSA
ncbi:unnamed protein product [Prunus armeniaca]